MTRWAWAGVVLWCLSAAGCRDGGACGPAEKQSVCESATAQGTEPQATPEPQAGADPQQARIVQPREGVMQQEAPEPLLMEMWATRPTSRPSGYRILADGKWWSYTDSDLIVETDPATGHRQVKEIRREEGWWDSECALISEELAKLKEVIRTSGVMNLPAETPPPRRSIIGGTDVHYTFENGGKRHRIHYVEGGGEVPGAIAAVEELASHLIFNSQQRWLRDRGEEHSPALDF